MSRLTALVRRLRGLFRRGFEDAETRDELRFHLEMETEKNLRTGMDPGEAGSLLRLVLSAGAWVIAVGVGVGAALAALVTRLAAQVVPGIAPGDPVVWAGVLLLIVGVTAAAHAEPARRILRLDLTRALHVE